MKDKYIKSILERLINKYENSCLSTGGSTKNIKINLNFNEKEIPEYVNEDSYKYENFIEDAVNYLEKLNYIEVIYKNSRIRKVLLNLNKIKEIYTYLNRPMKSDIENTYLNMLNSFKNKTLLSDKFIDLIENKIKNHLTYKSYFNNLEELKQLLIVLSNLESNTSEISRRTFSAKYLNDSKKLERIEGKIVNILKNIDEEDSNLEKYNIFKNPTYIYIRGNIKVIFKNLVIDTKYTNKELILSSNQVNLLNILELKYQKVITVENLTSFYDFKEGDYLLIYLGGFHNEIRRNLLKKIYEYNKNISFYHAGDIDVGGFLILNHLIEKTGIDFNRLKMDIKTLKEYRESSKSLTLSDRKRLNDLIDSNNLEEYNDVFKFMLDNNLKLEQENIIYDGELF